MRVSPSKGWSSALLTALTLIVACSSSNGSDSGGAAGTGGAGASAGQSGSSSAGKAGSNAEAGEGGAPASADAGAGNAGDDGNDAGFTNDAGAAGRSDDGNPPDTLPGNPNAPASAALIDVPAPPAADADIVDRVITSRFDVWLKASATVAQVNAALALIDAHLLAMTRGSSAISVAFDAVKDPEMLEQKRRTLEAAPGIDAVELATLAALDALPPGTARDEAYIGHLQTARFPAAWNLKNLAIKNCEARKVTVVVLDAFSSPKPAQVDTELPGFRAPELSGSVDHGWRVTSDIAAASFIDGSAVSGANPFIQCLNLVGVQAVNLTGLELQQRLWQSLPDGKVVLNVSLGHSAPTRCKAGCVASDFEGQSTWLVSGIRAAVDWRALARQRDDDLLISQAAGNDGQSASGQRYSLFHDADLTGIFTLPASSRIFGTPRLSVFDDADTFAPESAYSDYPSLMPSAQTRAALLALLEEKVPGDVGIEPGVISVGATTRGEPNAVVPSAFSNSNGDVYAVGEAIPGVSSKGDTPDEGTSFSAPQVAGLASYLWLLSNDLRNKPTSFTRSAIAENATFTIASGVHILDAYAAMLSLDAAETVTPSSAPIRLALLDLNSDGAFTEADMQEFAEYLVDTNGQPPRTWDRHDLNGDGYAGVGSTRFDLDREGSLQYGAASYTTVSENYGDQTLFFDESNATDLDILCYYAYSALYTGDTAARDAAIGSACGLVTENPVYDPVACEKNNPDHAGVLHQQCNLFFPYVGCCVGLRCIDPNPNDNYSFYACEP